MTSPINAVAVTVIPPPPTPCSARAPTSISIDCDSPHSTEPITKQTTAVWNTVLRPNRSPSLPTSTVTIVDANR
ncbi:hypothetical protein C1Y40_01378 [Mycobacterium talmoniae]|uniref:Uncharacterized protein n=1 Tax=Mycobacterium talmoniae TaxID=1858794 RepID=A0A2S8BP44_9MYCO|nr:hypothetical protein C1Y40_01378 [Mycobacterium talmoniae]